MYLLLRPDSHSKGTPGTAAASSAAEKQQVRAKRRAVQEPEAEENEEREAGPRKRQHAGQQVAETKTWDELRGLRHGIVLARVRPH